MTKFLWISAGAINGVHGSCLANMIPKYDINIVLIFIFIKYIFSFVSQHLTVLQLPRVIITHFQTAVCPEGQVNLCCVNAS